MSIHLLEVATCYIPELFEALQKPEWVYDIVVFLFSHSYLLFTCFSPNISQTMQAFQPVHKIDTIYN